MSKENLEIWLNFARFFLGSVVVVLVTFWVNSGFKDREIAITEQLYLANYKNEALSEDVEIRRRLAEYFSKVTISDDARTRWADYLQLIEKKLVEKQESEKNIGELKNRIEVLMAADSTDMKSIDEAVNLLNEAKLKSRTLEVQLNTAMESNFSGVKQLTLTENFAAEECARLFDAHEFKASLTECTDVLDANPLNIKALVLRCQAYERLEMYFDAATDCAKAILLNENYDFARFARGNLLSSIGRVELAIRDWQYIITTSASRRLRAVAASNIAWDRATCSNADLRNADEALRMAQLANELMETANFLDTLAAAYAESGNFQKAQAVADRAVSRSPNSASYKENQSLIKAGKPIRKDCSPIVFERRGPASG